MTTRKRKSLAAELEHLTSENVLVISNYGPGDTTFDSDVGSWNVTRAARDCAAGKHKAYGFDVAEVLAHNANIEVDVDKIAALVANPEWLQKAPPAIFAMEHGKIYLIDGHHRVRAMARLGEPKFLAYVIEEDAGVPYRMFFNGQRISPWMKKYK